MKKIIAAFIAVLFALTGCKSGNKKITVDTKTLTGNLIASAGFDDELIEIDSELVKNYFTLPDGCTASVFLGSGATAEIVGVFTSPDEAEAKKMTAECEKYIATQKASFESYVPAELDRLEKAIIFTKGKYTVLVVCDNKEKAQEIIDAAFKE